MKIGTKSVLFGAHQFILHPLMLWRAWNKLYGFTVDPRLIVAFFVHDLGYFGKPNMDGPEGKLHPYLGAKIMGWLFDRSKLMIRYVKPYQVQIGDVVAAHGCIPGITCSGDLVVVKRKVRVGGWYDFTLLHSRYLARELKLNYSALCVADKLATAVTPWWLYIPMTTLTGEIHEYMREVNSASDVRKAQLPFPLVAGAELGDKRMWFQGLCEYMKTWAYQDSDLRKATTPNERKTA